MFSCNNNEKFAIFLNISRALRKHLNGGNHYIFPYIKYLSLQHSVNMLVSFGQDFQKGGKSLNLFQLPVSCIFADLILALSDNYAMHKYSGDIQCMQLSEKYNLIVLYVLQSVFKKESCAKKIIVLIFGLVT